MDSLLVTGENGNCIALPTIKAISQVGGSELSLTQDTDKEVFIDTDNSFSRVGAVNDTAQLSVSNPTVSNSAKLVATDSRASLIIESSAYGAEKAIEVLADGTNFTVSHVGEVYAKGLQLVTGSQGLNKVLKSDANGIANWSDMSGLPSGTASETLVHNGTDWIASKRITNESGLVTIQPNETDNAGLELRVNSTYNDDIMLSVKRTNTENVCNINTDAVIASSLAGTGDRYIGADANGTLKAMPSINAEQHPENIRYVSSTFTVGGVFFSDITSACATFTGTVIVYEGTYTVTDLTLSCNILAIGKVDILGNINIGTVQIVGANLDLDEITASGSNCKIECNTIESISITNSTIEVKCYNTNYITLLGTNTLTYNGRIEYRLQEVTGGGNTNITSDYIGEIDINGNYINRIQCSYCGGLEISGSSINHLDIKLIDTINTIGFGGFSKTILYHTNINNALTIQDECVVKLRNCFIKASADSVITITVGQLVVSNTTIINTQGTGTPYSILGGGTTPVYIYGESCSNVAWDSITPQVSDLIIDTSLNNEEYF